MVVGETDEEAWQTARPAAEKLTAEYRRTGEKVKRRISTEEELETERWLRRVAIVGGPDTVTARITELQDEFGYGNFILRLSPRMICHPQRLASLTVTAQASIASR